MNTQPFSQTGQMIELCCEYLSSRCIWLYFTIMSRRRFRVNLLSLLPECQGTLCWKQARYNNGIRTYNHLVRKRTLNHLVKLAKWLSCVVSTYRYGAIDSMLLSCHVRISEWICTLWLPLKITHSRMQTSNHSTAQLLDKFG